MAARNRNKLIIDAFQVGWAGLVIKYQLIFKNFTFRQASQDSFSIHPKLVKKLKEFYLTTDPDRFFEDFIFFMRIPLSGVSERSPFIDRTLGRVIYQHSHHYLFFTV